MGQNLSMHLNSKLNKGLGIRMLVEVDYGHHPASSVLQFFH